MSDLESTVNEVIASFIDDEVLFTALDVSNKVKESIPAARHREVRDVVRNAWYNTIEVAGYGRTPISVTLTNGSVAQALLYHPLHDSWDLDSKYDAQKREQVVTAPISDSVTLVSGDSSASVSDDGDVVISAPQPVAASVPSVTDKKIKVVKAVSKPSKTDDGTPIRDQWKNIFATQPSMFPRQ